MMKIMGLNNWWLTKYFLGPLYKSSVRFPYYRNVLTGFYCEELSLWDASLCSYHHASGGKLSAPPLRNFQHFYSHILINHD